MISQLSNLFNISPCSSKGTGTNCLWMTKPYTNSWQTSRISLNLGFFMLEINFTTFKFGHKKSLVSKIHKRQFFLDNKAIYQLLENFKTKLKSWLEIHWTCFNFVKFWLIDWLIYAYSWSLPTVGIWFWNPQTIGTCTFGRTGVNVGQIRK